MRKTSVILVFTVLTLAVLTALVWYGPSRPDGKSPARNMPEGDVILLEAESSPEIARPFRCVEDANAAGGTCLSVMDMKQPEMAKAAGVKYEFNVESEGKYSLWLRTLWRDGCSNSVSTGIDGAELFSVGNDGTYGVWHWVGGPDLSLKQGRHTLRLVPREPLAKIDQILLVSDRKFYPQGILSPLGAAEYTEFRLYSDIYPLWISEGRKEKSCFVAAVGGAYQVGAEAFMIEAGIPCERLQEETIANVDTLRRYDLVWIAAPQLQAAPVWKAINTYVKEGGTAIVEMMHAMKPRRNTPARSELFAPADMGFRYLRTNITVCGKGSPLFEGIQDHTELYRDVGCSRIYGDVDSEVIETHGTVYKNRQLVGPAVMKKRVGEGVFYALAIPLSFTSMWRGTRFDDVGRRVLADAVGDNYSPLFASLRWNPPMRGRIHFSDDFMRKRGETGEWKIESGQFSVTGEKPDGGVPAFALKGTEGSWAAAGHPAWSSYRVSASILADEGVGGIWLSTSGGQRVSFTLDGKEGMAGLTEWKDGKPEVLHLEKVPGPQSGWRRLSVFCRDGVWQGYVDGRKLLACSARGDAEGKCGLVVLKGNVYLDDVSVVDTNALPHGSDKALGEEGSPRARPFSIFGIEPRTVYAPQWFLRPDPQGRHAVRVALPTYVPSLLAMDGEVLGTVPADPDGALVYLPEGKFPEREIALLCPKWRDYTFGSQLVEWYTTGGYWKHRRRWDCDNNWKWLGVRAVEPSVLWYRHRLEPPYSVCVQAAAANEFKGMPEFGRDFNLILSGDGKGLGNGIVIRTGPADEYGCEMIRNGLVIGTAEGIGLPKRHALHHRWFEIKAVVERGRVRFYYEDRLALDIALSEPIGPGYVGFWTQNNVVNIARATLSVSTAAHTPPTE